MSSYNSILKSTGLIAFVQIIQLVFGLARNKAVALFLGTQGFGIWGLYQTYIEMVSSFSTLGLEQSGVREISKANNEIELSKNIYIFKKLILIITGVFSIITAIFSKIISLYVFGSENYYKGIMIISFVIFFNGLFKGQKSILNGLRNMKGLALSQMIGSAIGSVATIYLVSQLGINGIPLFLLVISITATLSTWWYLKKMKLPSVAPEYEDAKKKIYKLITLGIGFCLTAIIASVMTYMSRIYLCREYDISTVGIYQASWTISNLYIGTILTAMGIDFMPRLMKSIDDNKKLVLLINEQMELGALVSSIGIVAILLFSNLLLNILYSEEFIIGSEIIKWQVLGVSLRVLGFPFSHSIMAKNKPKIYIIVQLIFWISDYLLLIVFSSLYGIDGLGINYFISYFIYLIITWFVCNRLYGYKSSLLLNKTVMISSMFIILAWFISQHVSGIKLYLIGIFILMSMTLWINNYMKKHMNISIVMITLKRFNK